MQIFPMLVVSSITVPIYSTRSPYSLTKGWPQRERALSQVRKNDSIVQFPISFLHGLRYHRLFDKRSIVG